MKTKLSLLFAVLFCALVSAQEDKVKGIWYNTEKTSKIKIFLATNGKYYGRIVWMQNPDKLDVNNPDDTKHSEPIFNSLIINNFTYDSDSKQWNGGTIYDPDNGKTYDCYMWFDDNNFDLLHVKGYIMGLKFAGREVEWTRTELEE